MYHGKLNRPLPLTLLALVITGVPLQVGAHHEGGDPNDLHLEQHQHEMHQHDMHQMAAAHDMSHTAGVTAFATLPAPGEKVMLDGGGYLVYSFDKRPSQLGTVILKVQAFDAKGEKDTSLTIVTDAGMPSMRGMHDVQDTCRLSKKGDYLVPVDISMPGDWEIKLTVMKGSEVVLRGRHQFDV